ncbi:3-phosphoshikimate 1-carboxyvinyltransferase [Tenacibaculum skagerrakense]|uniref:3-phosphoshikimate 1-carboxyvinyltransferase n=1 Tax=Tenacibaculum skagerrakense TaxID=186571 RepID=A0A4R2P412_9FLAO|nr:3-phosphoshikimate 1-carboxyvinyltransferase [Tenacibaculum skagerrakense]TCP28475.1 3-phosphoshikimate 1-carboxyvinyltransferase [Tenacibaculum skagerrakense]
MDLLLKIPKNQLFKNSVIVSGSKSESNRLLILQQLYPELEIENLSNSDDSIHMQHALKSNEEVADIGHAGTAMRFLTAFFASQEGTTKILQGSERMHNRPIKILVDALRDLGADITYLEKEGYPPLKINGKKLANSSVTIQGNVSSQYISALLLIASSLPNGLEIDLLGEITSIPYIKMTLSLLSQLGIESSFEGNIIRVEPKEAIENSKVIVEADWSSASYFYSLVALSEIGTEIKLSSYKKESLQGDSCLAYIYKHFGVSTTFEEYTILLKKEEETKTSLLELDLVKAPDIAQTIAVTCFALRVPCKLVGLHTLKIKETDRLEALKEEITKLGGTISVTNEELHLETSDRINNNIEIETYNDHRMAMAFTPLALKVPIKIKDAKVVTKSYRNFWEDFENLGIPQEVLK